MCATYVPHYPCLPFPNVCPRVCALLSLLIFHKCVPRMCLIVLACRSKMCAHIYMPYCPCLSFKNVCPRVCALLSLLVAQKRVPTCVYLIVLACRSKMCAHASASPPRLRMHAVSPITRMPLTSKYLAPNPGLKAAILEEVRGRAVCVCPPPCCPFAHLLPCGSPVTLIPSNRLHSKASLD